MCSDCENPYSKEDIRKGVRPVKIGHVTIGGGYPIAMQSMTNTNTIDVEKTVGQIAELSAAGCRIVRIAVPGKMEIPALAQIRKKTDQLKTRTALVADIHFSPHIAELAAPYVHKVRINPGNFVKSIKKSYSESEYTEELEKISVHTGSLIKVCRTYGTVIRIGINHGSMGPRITERYGTGAEAMVHAAREYIKLFEDNGYYDLVISLKASNVRMMIDAYRRLDELMKTENNRYPLHLGVTEAGEGLSGRIKSTLGLGALLQHGIGDTIRVSLSENPLAEIPVCREIINFFYPDKSDPDERPHDLTSLTDLRLTEYLHTHNTERPFIGYYSDARQAVIYDENEPAITQSFNPTPHTQGLSCNSCTNILSIPEQAVPCTAGDKKVIGLTLMLSNYIIDNRIDFYLLPYHNEFWLEVLKEIFQAGGLKNFYAEIISCPTCSRTGYDVGAAAAGVKKKFRHYKGLKIAVMGCEVNGPGEMACADYGYIGNRSGKVSLYRKGTLVKSNISSENAVRELTKLIESNWKK